MTDSALRTEVVDALDAADIGHKDDGEPVDVLIVALETDGDGSGSDSNGYGDWATDSALVVIAPAGGQRASRKALAHGADGFVVRDALERTLGPTILAVAAGQLCVPRDDRQGLNRQPLSYRERQALGMVVMGFSNGEIANRLYLAESTVKSHLSSAFRKLGVRSRAEAAALVLDPNEGVGVGILTIPETDGRHRVALSAKGG